MIYEPNKGTNFYDAVNDLKFELFRSGGSCREMSFNDIILTVYRDSNINDIAAIYDLKCKISRLEK